MSNLTKRQDKNRHIQLTLFIPNSSHTAIPLRRFSFQINSKFCAMKSARRSQMALEISLKIVNKQIVATSNIPVKMCQITWTSTASGASFSTPHTVYIKHIIMRCNTNKFPICKEISCNKLQLWTSKVVWLKKIRKPKKVGAGGRSGDKTRVASETSVKDCHRCLFFSNGKKKQNLAAVTKYVSERTNGFYNTEWNGCPWIRINFNFGNQKVSSVRLPDIPIPLISNLIFPD